MNYCELSVHRDHLDWKAVDRALCGPAEIHRAGEEAGLGSLGSTTFPQDSWSAQAPLEEGCPPQEAVEAFLNRCVRDEQAVAVLAHQADVTLTCAAYPEEELEWTFTPDFLTRLGKLGVSFTITALFLGGE